MARLIELRIEREPQKPRFALREDIVERQRERRSAGSQVEDTHAARPLGHEHAPVGEKLQCPWVDEAFGNRDDLDGDDPLPRRQARTQEIGRQAAGRRSTRTAQTLYSGIFDPGSSAGFVRKLAAESASFTNGTKTAPGRTASVTRA